MDNPIPDIWGDKRAFDTPEGLCELVASEEARFKGHGGQLNHCTKVPVFEMRCLLKELLWFGSVVSLTGDVRGNCNWYLMRQAFVAPPQSRKIVAPPANFFNSQVDFAP